MAYLIDSNIVIYYFNGLTDDEAIHNILSNSFKISIITKIQYGSVKRRGEAFGRQLIDKTIDLLSECFAQIPQNIPN